MYRRTVYELEEEGVVPLRARIAERLGQSGPTVSQTVARMERDGLLQVADDRHLQLSEVGRRGAIARPGSQNVRVSDPPAGRIGSGSGRDDRSDQRAAAARRRADASTLRCRPAP